MEAELLKDEAFKEIEDEISELTMIHSYLTNTNQRESDFVSIRNKEEFVLLDGAIKVPKILMLQNSNGITEILKKYSTRIDKDRIKEVEQATNLERKDILALMQDGMSLDDIESAANVLPFKDIAESAAIREMIRRDIEPQKLQSLQEKGIQVVALSNGEIQVNGLEKIAEVNENGIMTLNKDWFEKNLAPFQEIGLINIDDQLAVQEISKDEVEKAGTGSLIVVPLSKKREEMTKEEIEKQEIAKQLGEDPDRIISVIRIEDREGGSKLFNKDMTETSKPLIVRFRNNNFKVMEEKEDGTRQEMLGFEATPVSKQVAPLLKDTRDTLFTNLKAGEVRAGKTNPNMERYNIFQIRRAGESLDDDQNNLLYVGFSGQTDMNLIESMENGDARFARVPVSSVYPRSVYLESSFGTPKKVDIMHDREEETQKDIHDDPTIKFEDIEARKELLEKLEKVELQIREIEAEAKSPKKESSDEKTDSKSEMKADISDELADKSRKLPDLYSQRSEILMKLGLNQSQLVIAEEEQDRILGPKHY